ncbi:MULTISPECIES: DUF2332 domain-containing protein [Pontibacillus]|uniref:DUF2332 domain-containing protein n=1 Tax=Pontibacillus chungwhensis TaxID=265426 RepID=A0ABY8V199_9BACI|nr:MULTISPECIES: DUF2332 domain-containing protein [Pontibacillus]MCD5322235.1 DUF2332 domain-containing protein [Pontibacillus sp. HN14]WIF99529.1 DUF2332 domain-containing protein [Pontibacillus chungwhensis]
MNQLATRFTEFADQECDGSSPLYAHLARKIAEDEDLLDLATHANVGQPVPNLLFGAVHYLLLNEEGKALQSFYPSIADEPEPVEEVYPVFRAFCMDYREALIDLLQEKRVQTNEVRRCAYLYPVFCEIYKRTATPLSLIEIGTSAGLQLLFDQYAYSYGEDEWVGNEEARLYLSAKVRHGNKPALLKSSPPVHARVGLDVHISDITNEEERLWLKALIWPEHHERRQQFEQAARELIKSPPPLVEGDGITLLQEQANLTPSNTTLCIFHTHVANQLPETKKRELLKHVRAIGEKRDVFHIYNNMNDRRLHIDSIIGGVETHEVVGETDGHGRWFDWELNG